MAIVANKSVFLDPLGKYLAMQLLDHRVILFFNSCKVTILPSTVAIPCYIPGSDARGFPSLHTLTNTYYVLGLVWLGWFLDSQQAQLSRSLNNMKCKLIVV